MGSNGDALISTSEHGSRPQPSQPNRASSSYWMCTPEMALAMMRRWISEVPSKIV
jgi:hypothetical protein